MKQQMKQDFFSLRFLIIFFTIIVPVLASLRSEFTTMGLLLSAFLIGMLVLNDEKFNLPRFFYSMPINISSTYWGRLTFVISLGILWVLLEIVPIAMSGAITPSFALIAIVIQVSMIFILAPSCLSALKLLNGKIFRWFPVIIGYFILITASLYFTDVFNVVLNNPNAEMNENIVYLTLIALIIFSIAYMFLSSLIFIRTMHRRDKV